MDIIGSCRHGAASLSVHSIVQYPEIVQAIFNDGHVIGIHTWSHHALTTLTTDVVIAELMVIP